jgi:hypothetical protein
MVKAGTEYLTNDALMFWGSQFPGGISDDLKAWLSIRVPEVQELWRTVGTMDRRRGMWLELREQLESRDPTNAWTRQYDDLYIEAQIIALCKTVFSKRRKGRRPAALSILLNEFRQRPELLLPIVGWRADAADPVADRAQLAKLLRPIVPWRDSVVAHIEVDPNVQPLEWSAIDAAVTGVSVIFKRYARRLTGVNYQIDHEGPEWRTWQRVFSEPLFPLAP